MKPNVLFIIDSFEQGGSERQALAAAAPATRERPGECSHRLLTGSRFAKG